MIIKSKDNIDVEVTHCDAGHPPGKWTGMNLNTTAVWVKAVGGEWMCSRFPNAIRVAHEVKHSNAADLETAVGKLKEIECSSTGEVKET